MRRVAFLLVPLLAAAVLAGCGDPRQRQEVTGEVKVGGKPVEDGVINFQPLDGQATGEGAQIVKGKYRIPRDKGLAPGRYRVNIIAGNSMSGEGTASPDSPHAGKRVSRERVPPEYNEKSKVVEEVKRGGPNRFDYDIP